MLLQIVLRTPPWVFVLFAVLLGLGASQLRTRRVALGRVVGIAAGMVAFSLYGTLAAFGTSSPLALAGWCAGAALAAGLLLQRPVPAGTRYDAQSRHLAIPGSALPLALMMAIFFTKYGVAVATALHPALRGELRFALPASVLYGVCSGAFAGRAARLWRLARARDDRGSPSSVAGEVS